MGADGCNIMANIFGIQTKTKTKEKLRNNENK